MANLNIAIQIAAQDKASGPVGKIGQAFSGLKSSAQSGLASVQSILSTGLVAAAGIGAAAILTVGAAGFTVANDIQTAAQSIQSDLGATAEESERLAGIAGSVWGNNFADDISEAAGAVGIVRKQLGDLADDELKRSTENAFRLADSFDIGIGESVPAVDALMKNFGLTTDEAFGFITAGMQQGLNGSEDFLESIGEFSNQFAEGGADAGQFFAFMETGFQAGMLGTDKAADLFKEFNLRIQDGSSGVADALDAIGLSSKDMTAAMADGSLTSIDAMQMVKNALSNVDDENLQFQAGVALMGSQFEDLGASAVLGLEFIDTALEDVIVSTESLDAKYKTLPDTIEGFKRRGMLALKPIGDTLLGLANQVMPIVEQGFDYFEVTLVPIIERVAGAVGGFFDDLQSGQGFLTAFSTLAIDGFGASAEQVQILYDNVGLIGQWFTDNVQPVIDMVAGFVSWNDVLIAAGVVVASVVIPSLISVVIAAAPIILAVGALVGAVALLRHAWENNWGDIQGKTQAAWDFIQPYFQIASDWLSTNIPVALEALRSWWVDQAWPAIQDATQTVWSKLQQIWTTLTGWITGKLIPTVTGLYITWRKRFIQIQTATQNVWNFIKAIWTELGRWINDNIMPWVSVLSDLWDEKWGSIESKMDSVWGMIEPIWESFKSWMQDKIPPALDNLRDKFSGVMESISSKISPVKSLWDDLVIAIKGFWDWISSRTFSFKINIPDLPDWAIPGSPIPLHTAWKNFANDIGNVRIAPKFDTAGVLPGVSALSPAAGGPVSSGGGLNIVFQPGAIQVSGSGSDAIGDIQQAIEEGVKKALAKSGQRADMIRRGI